MADQRPSSPSGGEQRSKEEQVSISHPAGILEMEDLSSTTQPTPANAQSATIESHNQSESIPDTASAKDNAAMSIDSATAAPSVTTKVADKPAAPLPDDSLSIDPADTPSGSGDATLACQINLLLTNGARHPFRIDEKYLTKRNVSVTGKTEDGRMDPFSITVYTLKELILRDWRKEWEQPPREPTSIRLIHFGKLLEDRLQLKEYSFSTENSNVVHMTVKPQEIIDEEEAAKQVKNSGRETRRGGCCVIL